MITFPKTLDEARASEGTYRAGGTDLQDRRHLGRSVGPIVDLRDLPGLDQVEAVEGGGFRVGARVTVAALAADPRIRAGYPALAQAAGGLATPQIRTRATVGGNLLQDVRCWYFRNPLFSCLKTGGTTCLAREGDNLFHSCFDQGPCLAPHPSTVAMALMAYDATAEIEGGEDRSVAALMGDGRDPRRTHSLEAGALVTAVVLPPPTPGERSAYFRAINRERAEWPLVEVVARLVMAEGAVTAASVAVGGVANTPLRLGVVEEALAGTQGDQAALEAAAARAADGARPPPHATYKLKLVPASVLTACEMALASAPVEAASPAQPANGGAL